MATATATSTARLLISKFQGRCTRCGTYFPAGTRIEWAAGKGAKHADTGACAVAEANKVEAPTAAPLNMKPIADFILAAKARGLKWPATRFLAPGGGELRLSVAGPGSKAPGSIQVKIDDAWIGRVEPNGTVYGFKLVARTDVQATLTAIAADPVAAAKAYGALTCRCSFCNRSLTDEGSVEVGYGPVCAKHFGLPHSAKGAKALTTTVPSLASVVADTDAEVPGVASTSLNTELLEDEQPELSLEALDTMANITARWAEEGL